MKLRKFYAADLSILDVQATQTHEIVAMPRFVASVYEARSTPAATVYDEEGVIACLGLLPLGERKALSWAFLGARAGQHLLGLTRLVLRTIAASDFQRVEATVISGFNEGHRWAKMLGYELETPAGMKNYDSSGNTYYQYAKVR